MDDKEQFEKEPKEVKKNSDEKVEKNTHISKNHESLIPKEKLTEIARSFNKPLIPKDKLAEIARSFNKPLIPKDKLDEIQRILNKPIIPKQTLAEIQKSLNKAVEPIQDFIDSYYKTLDMFAETIRKVTTSIDWDKLEKSFRDKLKNYEKFMSEFEKECWAIDAEMLDAIETGDYKDNEIDKYVEDHLDEYIEFFQKDSLYESHIPLIIEAYELYNLDYYKHCVFSLLAVFENILAEAFNDYDIEKKKKVNVYNKTSDYVKTTENELALNTIFFRRVYNVYTILYKPSWNSHPKQLNRNWIMHGSYNYEKIEKIDILKLFQLLKAASILNYISFEDDIRD